MRFNSLRRWIRGVASRQFTSTHRRRIHRGQCAATSAEILESRLVLSPLSILSSLSILRSISTASRNAPLDHLVFSVQPPATTQAGSVFSVTVAIENSAGKIDQSNHDSVSLSGPFTAASVTKNFNNGKAVFSGLQVDTAGSCSLAAADTANNSRVNGINSRSFTITPKKTGAEHLSLSQVPATGAAGQPLGVIKAAVEDQYGNIVTTNNGDLISLGVYTAPPGHPLSFDGGPTTSPSPTHNGVAFFNGVILDKAGAYTLSATDTTHTLNAAISSPITIGAGARRSSRSSKGRRPGLR